MAHETDSQVSVRELYALIDKTKTEIMGPIQRIERKFDDLESGRLSNLEKEISTMQGKMMMVPVIISIAISVFFFVMNYILYQLK